jgi:hypothetical protein
MNKNYLNDSLEKIIYKEIDEFNKNPKKALKKERKEYQKDLKEEEEKENYYNL